MICAQWQAEQSPTPYSDRSCWNPEAAVKEAGIDLTPEQMKALKDMDKAELEKGLTDLDSRLTMACWGKAQNICGWD